MPKQPISDPSEPDEYGRIRVRDLDTGHERTIHAAEYGHGNYAALEAPASDICGDPVPMKLAATPKPLSGQSNSGQQADTQKENTDG